MEMIKIEVPNSWEKRLMCSLCLNSTSVLQSSYNHHIPVDVLLCEKMTYTVPRMCCCVDASLCSGGYIVDSVVTVCGGEDWKFLRRLSIRDVCYIRTTVALYS